MSITDALTKLTEAHGVRALIDAFTVLQRQVRKKRRDDGHAWGPLAQTYTAAIRIWDAQKADGVSEADRVAGLEQTLRAAWPAGREWKYLCDRCLDTGWDVRLCTEAAPCGRPFRLPQQKGDDRTGQGRCVHGHTFTEPCWCQKGAAIKRQLLRQPDPQADFTAAGKSAPTRVGR